MATIRKRQRKDGEVYLIQVKLTDKGSGQQILRSRSWKPESNMTAKQAERAVAVFADAFEKEVKESISGGKSVSGNPNITFREFSYQWLERIKKDHSLNYYETSKDIINYTCQFIGGYKLRELTPAIIQNYFNKLDERKHIINQITPKPNFREILQSYGFNYVKLRYDYHIQSCTLANAFGGKAVSQLWSEDLCKRINIPFDDLFDKQISEVDYAYETTHKYKATVRTILSMAKKNRLVIDNYATADYIDFPKKPSKKIVCMDDEQAKLYYKTLMNFPDLKVKTATLLFLLTGFRRGEVAGLEWSDIDFEKSTISINRSITTVKGHGAIEKEPKTEGSVRTITAAQILMKTLREYKLWWDIRKESYGDYYMQTDKVFTQENGKNINPSTLYTWHTKILKNAGIEHFSLHSVRHTNITMQIAAGVPIVTVSARAGHARASTTTDTYAHFIHSSDVMAAQTIDNLFCGLEDMDTQKTNSKAKPQNKKIELVSSFRQAKNEIERLGLKNYEEYLEYLEFVEAKNQHLNALISSASGVSE